MNNKIFLLIFLWGYPFVLTAQSFPTVSSGQLQFKNPYSFETILKAYQLNGKLAGEYGPFGLGQHRFSVSELSPGMYAFQVGEKNKNLSLQHFKIFIIKQ